MEANHTGLLKIHGVQAGDKLDISGSEDHQALALQVSAVSLWNHHSQLSEKLVEGFKSVLNTICIV